MTLRGADYNVPRSENLKDSTSSTLTDLKEQAT